MIWNPGRLNEKMAEKTDCYTLSVNFINSQKFQLSVLQIFNVRFGDKNQYLKISQYENLKNKWENTNSKVITLLLEFLC